MFGGAGAGGWSSGIGGQSNGPRAARSSDGWDDEYLGKVYDAEVVQRASALPRMNSRCRRSSPSR